MSTNPTVNETYAVYMSKLVRWSHFVYVCAGPYRRKITIAVGCFGVLYVSVSSRDSCKSVKIKKYFLYFLFSKKSFENKKSFLENYILENISPCRADTKTMYKDGSGHTEAKSPSSRIVLGFCIPLYPRWISRDL